MTDINKWWISLNEFWKKTISVHISLHDRGVTYERVLESKQYSNEEIGSIYQTIFDEEFQDPSIIDFDKALSLNFIYLRSIFHEGRHYNHEITDIRPLAILNQLEIIDFSFNAVADLTPINNFRNLKVLHFECNCVDSIDSLVNLNNLIDLNFGRNKVHDLSPLQNKQWLRSLKCEQNPINSLKPIQNMTRLEELYCSDETGSNGCYIDIEDLNYLANLKNLKKLSIYNPRLENSLILNSVTGQPDPMEKLQSLIGDLKIIR
jgi:hypothetical protein